MTIATLHCWAALCLLFVICLCCVYTIIISRVGDAILTLIVWAEISLCGATATPKLQEPQSCDVIRVAAMATEMLAFILSCCSVPTVKA